MENTKPITDEQFSKILSNYDEAVSKAEELCNIIDRIDKTADTLNNEGYRCTPLQLKMIQQRIEKLAFIVGEIH